MLDAVTDRDARSIAGSRSRRPGVKGWAASLIVLAIVAGGVIAGPRLLSSSTPHVAAAPPSVAVSVPLQRQVDGRIEFLGQFSAVQQVELRAQVGGTLTQIGFKDGDIVHKGDLLFQIDPTPYQIKLSEAIAQVESAHARLDLANRELFRARLARKTGSGSVETADQKAAEQHAAQAPSMMRGGGRPRRPVRPRSYPHHRALHGPHRHSPGLRRQPDLRQPGGHQPHHLARHDRLDRPDLFEFRHERGRLHDVPA